MNPDQFDSDESSLEMVDKFGDAYGSIISYVFGFEIKWDPTSQSTESLAVLLPRAATKVAFFPSS